MRTYWCMLAHNMHVLDVVTTDSIDETNEEICLFLSIFVV